MLHTDVSAVFNDIASRPVRLVTAPLAEFFSPTPFQQTFSPAGPGLVHRADAGDPVLQKFFDIAAERGWMPCLNLPGGGHSRPHDTDMKRVNADVVETKDGYRLGPVFTLG